MYMKSLHIHENLVKSAERAVDVMEFVALSPNGKTHTEIADALGIPGSSTTGLLNTLVCKDCLVFDKTSKLYTLGPKVLYMAGLYLDHMDLVEIGRPYVKRLYELTEESVALTVAIDGDIQFIYRLNSTQPVIRPLQVGARSPIYATAAGKAMLAFRPDDDIEDYLNSTPLVKITPKTVCDKQELLAELEAVRRGEPASCLDGLKEGVTGFARPVLRAQGKAVGAMAVTTPTFRLSDQKKQLILAALVETADQFSERLGYSRNGP